MQTASTKRTLRQIGLGVLFVAFCTLLGSLGQAQPGGPRIVINIPATTLYLYSGDTIIRSYPVGVGKPSFKTPLGRYQVIRKVVNPGWENPYLAPGRVQVAPGEDNPLGTRWIGFKESAGGEYGIHGTDNPGSVGRFSSHGCVRMRVPDAEDLFNRISVGTPVEIKYDLVSLRENQGKVSVQVYGDAYGRGYPSAPSLHQRILTTYPGVTIQPAQLMAALKARSAKVTVVASSQSDSIPMDDRLAMGGESDLVLKGGPRSIKSIQTDVPVHMAQAVDKPLKPQPAAKPLPAPAKVPTPTKAPTQSPGAKAAEKPATKQPASEVEKAPVKEDQTPTEPTQETQKPAPKATGEKPVADPPPVSAKPSIPFSHQIHQIKDKIPHVEMPSSVPHLPGQSTGLVLILAIIGAFVVIRLMVMGTRKFSQVKASLQAMATEPDHSTVMAHEPMMLRDEPPVQAPAPHSPYANAPVVGTVPGPVAAMSTPIAMDDEDDEDDEPELEETLEDSTEAAQEEDWPSTDFEDEAEELPQPRVEESLTPRYEQPVEELAQPAQLSESPFNSSLARYLSMSQQQRQQ